MPELDYNRYSLLKNSDGSVDIMPFIKLGENNTDKFERWNSSFSRMDKISQKYYNNPFYDFLIMLANPTHLNEWDIPDNELIRIPFPLSKAKADYEAQILKIKNNNY